MPNVCLLILVFMVPHVNVKSGGKKGSPRLKEERWIAGALHKRNYTIFALSGLCCQLW